MLLLSTPFSKCCVLSPADSWRASLSLSSSSSRCLSLSWPLLFSLSCLLLLLLNLSFSQLGLRLRKLSSRLPVLLALLNLSRDFLCSQNTSITNNQAERVVDCMFNPSRTSLQNLTHAAVSIRTLELPGRRVFAVVRFRPLSVNKQKSYKITTHLVKYIYINKYKYK